MPGPGGVTLGVDSGEGGGGRGGGAIVSSGDDEEGALGAGGYGVWKR